MHGARFKDWNSIRSRGLAGSSGGPIWLCAQPPAKGTRLPSLGGKVEVLVFLDAASLSGAGVEIYEVLAAAGKAEEEAVLEDGAVIECLASTGDESGRIGAWHIEKALNARDGTELMSAEEAVPLREARTRELAARAQKVAAAAAAKVEKARARALEEERRVALEAAAQPRVEAAPRYNPYLVHHEEGITAVKKATNRTSAGPTVVRKRCRDDDDDDDDDE